MAKKFLEADEFGWAASVLEDWATALEENDTSKEEEDSVAGIRVIAKKLTSCPDNLTNSEWQSILLWLHQELSD